MHASLMAGLLCMAGSASAGPDRREAPSARQAPAAPVPDPCTLEMYAYLKVAAFAKQLGEDGDVLAEALDDLGNQFMACIDGASDDPDEQASVLAGPTAPAKPDAETAVQRAERPGRP